LRASEAITLSEGNIDNGDFEFTPIYVIMNIYDVNVSWTSPLEGRLQKDVNDESPRDSLLPNVASPRPRRAHFFWFPNSVVVAERVVLSSPQPCIDWP
jgi:hypothetical protein